jgi:hypothetical protein
MGQQVGLDVVADPLRVLLIVDLVGVDADRHGGLVGDAVDEQAATGVGHRGDVLGQLVPPALARRLRQLFLPVQVIGLGQVGVGGLLDHVEVERAGRRTEVLVQSRPGTGHARQHTKQH